MRLRVLGSWRKGRRTRRHDMIPRESYTKTVVNHLSTIEFQMQAQDPETWLRGESEGEVGGVVKRTLAASGSDSSQPPCIARTAALSTYLANSALPIVA